MDQRRVERAACLKSRRREQLITTLSSMRQCDTSDVVLFCDNVEFFAHKVVLQASGRYFQGLFKSGMVESESRIIHVQEMASAALESILDFIYLGSVENIKSDQQFKEVMKASHLIGLDELYQYCCSFLAESISLDNFFDLFQISLKYEITHLKSEILFFWMHNSPKLVSSKRFLDLSYEEVTELLDFLKLHMMCLDTLLLGLPSWLQHDVDIRTKFIPRVLDYAEAMLLTKDCVKSLIKNKDFMGTSKNLAIKMNELCCTVLVADDFHQIENPHLTPKADSKSHIIFFGTERTGNMLEIESNITADVSQITQETCLQHFDLANLTWISPLPFNYICPRAAMCQYKNYLYIINGINHLYLMYDVELNRVKRLREDKVLQRIDAGICYFKSNLFLIGGKWRSRNSVWEDTSTVCYAQPGSDEWYEASPCKLSNNDFIRVLTSSDFIYVVECWSYPVKNVVVRFNAGPDTGHQWETINMHSERELLSGNNLFVFKNTLHALYITDGDTVFLRYDHSRKKLESRRFLGCPDGVKAVTHVYAIKQSQYLFVVTDSNIVPTFLWDPDEGNWMDSLFHNGTLELTTPYKSILYAH